MQCERQGCTNKNALQRVSMTCYINLEGVAAEELNPKPILCDECWEEYQDYWNEMWAEYRSSQGV